MLPLLQFLEKFESYWCLSFRYLVEVTSEDIRSRVFLCQEVFDYQLSLLNSFSLDLMQNFLSTLGHIESSPSMSLDMG